MFSFYAKQFISILVFLVKILVLRWKFLIFGYSGQNVQFLRKTICQHFGFFSLNFGFKVEIFILGYSGQHGQFLRKTICQYFGFFRSKFWF